MPRIDLLLTALIGIALLVACNSSESDPTAEPTPGGVGTPANGGPPIGTGIGIGPGISIADALASDLDQPLLVNGALVATADSVRLCDVLLESYPPQCGGPYLTVEGLDLDTVDNLQEASGVSWTDFPFQLLGTVKDGVITVNSLTSG
jgi:hypothetical protein